MKSASDKTVKQIFIKILSGVFKTRGSKIKEEDVTAHLAKKAECGCEFWYCAYIGEEGIFASIVELSCNGTQQENPQGNYMWN